MAMSSTLPTQAANTNITEPFMPDFLIYALIAACSLALVAGPLGSFVVWQRLAYFGDTLAHGALLGVALALFAELNVTMTIVATSIAMAVCLFLLQSRADLGSDSLLGILSHTALAAGLVGVSLAGTSVDLFAYLFGDLLTTDATSALVIAGISALAMACLAYFWRDLLLMVIDEALAKVEGVPVAALKLMLLVLVAIVVALAIRVIGVLLITALLVIPAAAGRRLAVSPEGMAICASMLAVLAVFIGLGLSFYANTPAGPSIVLATSFLFVTSLLKRQRA